METIFRTIGIMIAFCLMLVSALVTLVLWGTGALVVYIVWSFAATGQLPFQ